MFAMKINDLEITQTKLDVNYKLYLFLKELNGGNGLTEAMLSFFLELISSFKDADYENARRLFIDKINNWPKLSDSKKENILSLFYEIDEENDFVLLKFALKILAVKPLLLEEAKLAQTSKLVNTDGLHLLSLEFDRISKSKPYYTRVNGALVSLVFFEKIESGKDGFLLGVNADFTKSLIEEAKTICSMGVEPNQIFMIMFMECINQSIVSDAGGSYEDRIEDVLVSMGIPRESIKKIHDKDDNATEFDFFFELNGKTIGIGAKRTLRERYKQFIKTAQMSQIDIMIEVTLGLDLTQNKVEAIANHGVYLFVADEIYNSLEYLHKFDKVYPVSKFTMDVFKSLK